MLKRMLFLCVAAAAVVACNTEENSALPGIYLKSEVVETFPTDTLHLSGTISNYIGLETLTFRCSEWNYEYSYDLSAQKPVVFNYEHQLIVPETATFDDPTLEITAKDINGLESVKSFPVKYLVDQIAPVLTPALYEQFGVDYDSEAGVGVWNAEFSVYDRRGLKSVTVEIPKMDYKKSVTFEDGGLTFEDARMSYYFKEDIIFTQMLDYDIHILAVDMVGNKYDATHIAIVMEPEEEDPVMNWPGLYLVNAQESPEDYVDGYYKYMDPCYDESGATIPYTYQTTFYAPTENMQLYMVPTKSMDADIIGLSPRISSKILNKRDYVVPITLPNGAGYYGIYVDLVEHKYEFWEVDPEASTTKCTEDVWISGTGFNDFSDWGALEAPMARDGYRYTQEGLSVKAGFVAYYFYTAEWARVFRASEDSHWWYESAEGPTAKPSTEYEGEVVITFDSVLPYGTIKKKNE